MYKAGNKQVRFNKWSIISKENNMLLRTEFRNEMLRDITCFK